jgi:hypothetical protein
MYIMSYFIGLEQQRSVHCRIFDSSLYIVQFTQKSFKRAAVHFILSEVVLQNAGPSGRAV